MGELNNPWFASASFQTMKPDLERDAREKAEYDANRESVMRRHAAEASAMRELADMNCPEDIKEFGRRNGIPCFAEFTWMAGFAAGYAIGLARGKRTDDEQVRKLNEEVAALRDELARATIRDVESVRSACRDAILQERERRDASDAIVITERVSAARCDALEEAAAIAARTIAGDDIIQKSAGCLTAGQRIATAIRALKDKEAAR